MNIPPNYQRRIIASRKNSAHRVTASEEIVPDKTSTERQSKAFVDRRKGNRRGGAESRGPYDSRSGKDRRKRNLGYPSIRTEV